MDDDGPVKRHIAITLSLLAVLGAGLAIAQRDAGTKESTTARETTRAAVRALRANVDVATAGGNDARRRAEGRQLAAAQETLRQRALATTRITWNTRSTQYTTVIAVLAAALFFVGYALVVEGSLRPYSYGLGVATGIFAAAWAAWIFHLPIPETPTRAIDAAARATVLSADGRPVATTAPPSWAARARACWPPTPTIPSAARSPGAVTARRAWSSTTPSGHGRWIPARISSAPASSRCRRSSTGSGTRR
jgi:hypothetical protein